MKAVTCESIEIEGRKVEYHLIRSKSARKLRIRVGVDGVEVVQPAAREPEDAVAFLQANENWLIDQLTRVERFRSVRRPQTHPAGEILFRGEPTPVRIEKVAHWQGANRISLEEGSILIVTGKHSRTRLERSLENWLRKQARVEIERQLESVTKKLKRLPNKIYVMGQRTKWGNCSARNNLSFNWRLIMAPDFVIQYLVTHEAVHLAIPDHSKKFWLTVQSFCPNSEKARRWLSANGRELLPDLCIMQYG